GGCEALNDAPTPHTAGDGGAEDGGVDAVGIVEGRREDEVGIGGVNREAGFGLVRGFAAVGAGDDVDDVDGLGERGESGHGEERERSMNTDGPHVLSPSPAGTLVRRRVRVPTGAGTRR